LRDFFGLRQRGVAAGRAKVRADGDVLPHRLLRERLDDLEGAGHAQQRVAVRRVAGDVCAGEAHRPFVRPQEAGHQREQGRLARAIGPDQCAEAARRDVEAHAGHRLEAAERPRHALQRQQRIRHRRPFAPHCGASAAAHRPRQCRAA
jgi:hypothetical protein